MWHDIHMGISTAHTFKLFSPFELKFPFEKRISALPPELQNQGLGFVLNFTVGSNTMLKKSSAEAPVLFFSPDGKLGPSRDRKGLEFSLPPTTVLYIIWV